MSRPSTPTAPTLPTVNRHAAGLDIGSEEIGAAGPADRAAQPVRSVGTFTSDLYALADWLVACHIETVALESTGVYWLPIYEIREARGLKVYVVNARHLKRVAGRNSDIQDCQWLPYLHSVGWLNASFRSEGELGVLRTYLRPRATLIEYRAAPIQHRQQARQPMNLQLTQVVKDITGGTGRAILRAIVAGERDAVKLAQWRAPRGQHTEAAIAKALTGNYGAEHVFALKPALALYDVYTQQMREGEAQIERHFESLPVASDDRPPLDPTDKRDTHSKKAPSYAARTWLYRLTDVDLVVISGLNGATGQTIVSEVGTDRRRFASEKDFCAWLGLAPHNDISGGKVLRSRTLKRRTRAGQAFRMAAQAVSRSTDSMVGAFYRRMRARLGPKPAMVATAHKIARTFYHLLKHRTSFHEMGADEYDKRSREREMARLPKRAAKLGLTVVPTAGTTPPA